MDFCAGLRYTVLFCSVLFCSVLFCSVHILFLSGGYQLKRFRSVTLIEKPSQVNEKPLSAVLFVGLVQEFFCLCGREEGADFSAFPSTDPFIKKIHGRNAGVTLGG